MKEIEVTVIKYQTEDGEIFDNPNEAEHYERMLKGIRRVCTSCKGSGRVLSVDMRSTEPCQDCNQKGWQEKVEVWK